MMREFVEQIAAKSHREVDDVRMQFGYKKLLTRFTDISNNSFCRVQDLIDIMLSERIVGLGSLKDPKTDISAFIEKNFLEFKDIIDKLYRSYQRKLWKFLLGRFIHLFTQYSVLQSVQYTPEEIDQYIKRLRQEFELIRDIFSSILKEKDMKEMMKKGDNLMDSLTLPPDQIKTPIQFLMLDMRPDFNTNCSKCILRLRGDIPRDQKIAILGEVLSEFSALRVEKNKNFGRMFKLKMMVNYRVKKFITILRDRAREKKKIVNQKKRENQINELNIINNNTDVDVEEEHLSARGYLKVSRQKFNSPQQKQSIIENAQKGSYQNGHFSFLDDIFVWKNQHTSNKPFLRVFLTSIEEVGVESDKYFFFTRKGVILVFMCPDQATRAKWIKALIFLREQSLAEQQEIQFEEFSCIQGSDALEELFVADKIVYDYDPIEIEGTKPPTRKAFNLDTVDVGDSMGQTAPVEGLKDQPTREEIIHQQQQENIEKSNQQDMAMEQVSDMIENTGKGKQAQRAPQTIRETSMNMSSIREEGEQDNNTQKGQKEISQGKIEGMEMKEGGDQSQDGDEESESKKGQQDNDKNQKKKWGFGNNMKKKFSDAMHDIKTDKRPNDTVVKRASRFFGFY